jgi:flavodoxin
MTTEEKEPKINSCPEFPWFGARYPDARCIDGFLWDMDKYEDGMFYGGGEDLCPFCNTEAFLKEQEENEEDMDKVKKWMEETLKKYGHQN